VSLVISILDNICKEMYDISNQTVYLKPKEGSTSSSSQIEERWNDSKLEFGEMRLAWWMDKTPDNFSSKSGIPLQPLVNGNDGFYH